MPNYSKITELQTHKYIIILFPPNLFKLRVKMSNPASYMIKTLSIEKDVSKN